MAEVKEATVTKCMDTMTHTEKLATLQALMKRPVFVSQFMPNHGFQYCGPPLKYDEKNKGQLFSSIEVGMSFEDALKDEFFGIDTWFIKQGFVRKSVNRDPTVVLASSSSSSSSASSSSASSSSSSSHSSSSSSSSSSTSSHVAISAAVPTPVPTPLTEPLPPQTACAPAAAFPLPLPPGLRIPSLPQMKPATAAMPSDSSTSGTMSSSSASDVAASEAITSDSPPDLASVAAVVEVNAPAEGKSNDGNEEVTTTEDDSATETASSATER